MPLCGLQAAKIGKGDVVTRVKQKNEADAEIFGKQGAQIARAALH